jgi:glycerophosphoryl diester phosphodiesterase
MRRSGDVWQARNVSTPRTGFPYLDVVQERPGAVLAFAHRGGALHPDLVGLENTLKAFHHAVGLGYRYLETDVHVTADGTLLAFHDADLSRVTDGTGDVADLSLSEVRRARIGGAEPIPTLAELVDAFPEARFNIDIKADGAVPPLAAFVRSRGLSDRVLVGSFSIRRLRRLRRLAGSAVPTAAHTQEVLVFRACPSGWLAGRLAGGFAACQVPHRRGRLTVLTPGLVARVHAAGKHVHVWTVDDAEEMHRLLDRGVDGLFTDRTDILKDVLTGRGQWWSGA